MAVVLLIIVGTGSAIGIYVWKGKAQRADLLYHEVKLEPLEVTVVERGTLEAAENKDVICQVKSSGRGSQFATTIKWVIDDGTQVKKGDKIVELDKSGLEDQERTQQIAVDRARAEFVAAEGQVEIVKSQNDSDLSAAMNTLEIAQIDYEKYTKGEYLQALNEIEGKIKKAESDLEMIKDRASWTERMVMKKYLSSSQAEAESARLMGTDLDLKKLREEKRVLTDYTKRRQETDLLSKVNEARRALDRVRTQNKAKLTTAESDFKTKKSLLDQELEKLKDVKEQIGLCVLNAPGDGMVVYYVDERSRSGFGSQQSVIAQGETVREGQRLIRIPNLDHMLVNTRVHEAMVSRLKAGMKVDVRVDAFPDRVLKAKVRSVATIAAQNDWRSADVKMYPTIISVEEAIGGLKPGMSAECSIFVEGTNEKVIALPIQAIVGGAELGPNRKCFVKTPEGPVEREIVVGLSNDKVAEVRSGLKVGDLVVLNPKVLIGDRAKTRQPNEFEKAASGGSSTGGDTKAKAPDGKAPETKAPGTPGGSPGLPGAPTGPGDGAPKGKGKMKGMTPGGDMSGQDMDALKKRMEEFNDKMKKATPQERKKLLEQVPEQFRGATRDRIKQMGLEIAD